MRAIMMKPMMSVLSLLLMTLMLVPNASATGPRVTASLFAVDKSEVHTLDFPPYISTNVVDGGPISEIVNTALSEAGIDAVITIHPLQRIVDYYLLQENALAVMGRHLHYNSEVRDNLIYIPVAVMVENYYYYKPSYPDGLNWNGKLSSLKGKTYGAHRGEGVDAYRKAGIKVDEGRTINLLKRLAAAKVDFISVPSLTANWLLDRYMKSEKANFAVMEREAGEDVLFIMFNRNHPDGAAAAEKFRKALAKMVDEGRTNSIMQRYLGSGSVRELHTK